MSDRSVGAGLQSPLLDRLVASGVIGGQFADGSQKDGFLKYEKGRPAGTYDIEAKAYVPLASIAPRCDGRLGPLPDSGKPWKSVIQAADRPGYLLGYFRDLRAMATLGADLAKRYGRKAKDAGLELVKDGVAEKSEDVNTVMLTGFYHAYGPVNSYFDE
jgi:hypothetical protein